jgi:hypothetical protein
MLSGQGSNNPFSKAFRAPLELSGVGAICWSCFGIFLAIGLISLLQQTRTLIRNQLLFGLPGQR